MILVIGASGIIGQHLRLTQPGHLTGLAIYTSRDKSCPNDFGLKLDTEQDVRILLDRWAPDVVVNLAGENRPDYVENDWRGTVFINMLAPTFMADWCKVRRRRMIHVSTQGVFGGTQAPYRAALPPVTDPPVNLYGQQKLFAEREVSKLGGEIARLTFVLGIRPLPHVGRANPLEGMLAAISGTTQVEDRYFSPVFASDAAKQLWRLVEDAPRPGHVWNIGLPIRMSRAEIAEEVLLASKTKPSFDFNRVKHDEAFPKPKWAPRPLDTTFYKDARFSGTFETGLSDCLRSWRRLLDYMDAGDRASEIGMFLGIGADVALNKLLTGFGPLHNEVTKDFHSGPPIISDHYLLEWYRRTNAYIWELTAYHLDPGFNYMGMCEGVINHLQVRNRRRPLCIGDGVGDLTMRCADAGLSPIYHDLKDSRTAEFAKFRMKRRYGHVLDTCLTAGWDPEEFEPNTVDAILAFDFFEHVTDVENWVIALKYALKPGGLFLAQNAFGIGDAEHGGDMPMHLSRNNRYEKDWDPLLDRLGFIREEGNWRRKP